MLKILPYYTVQQEPELPEPHQNFYPEPDPHKNDAAPQHCLQHKLTFFPSPLMVGSESEFEFGSIKNL
jgi:hypothetical protein